MSVKINIKSNLTDEQSKLVERLALAIELKEPFNISVLIARLEATGVKVYPGAENSVTSSISTEQ